MAGIRENPYVGPRPFPRGKRLYGRDRELRELFDLLVARRVVLLHSPSGAGKSSLVQAALIPRLKSERFDVWRTIRLNLDPGALEGEVRNRFVASTLASLEDGVPEPHRRDFAAIVGLRLAEYLEGRPRRDGAPPSVALVFDQFEEILTVDPLGADAKREFFAQLGKALRHPDYWALFVLREDYLAALSPYRDLVPTKLANTYRIDLLGPEAAREAIVEPAREGGRIFPAADLLVDDLRTVQVQQPDGSFVAERGPRVEPMQLQVVCLRLWDAMPEDDLSIAAEDLEQFGDVDEALAHYYRETVGHIAGGRMVRERKIREWFSECLIAAGGVRSQVLREPDESGGLANNVIESLLDTHLIRAEKRAGATWYELAHDRLLEPVQNDNAAWRDEHLSEVQRRALLWEHQDRNSGLLLKDEGLTEGESWAAENETSLTEVDRLFLEASRTAQAAAERERRQALWIRRLGVAATIVSVVALVASVFAGLQWREAERQKKEAIEQKLEAVRQRQLARDRAQKVIEQKLEADRQRQLARDRAQEAIEQKLEADRQRRLAEEREQETERQRTLTERQRLEADRQRQLAEDRREEADRQGQAAKKAQERAEHQALIATANRLATAALSNRIVRPDLASLLAIEAWNTAKSFEARHTLLSTVQANPRLQTLIRPGDESTTVRSVAFSADGATLASGSGDGIVRLWDVTSHQPAGQPLAGHRNEVWSVTFSPDGTTLASGSTDGTVRLWDVARCQPLGQPLGHGDSVWSVAFSPDGATLASGASGRRRPADGVRDAFFMKNDGTVRLWEVASRQPLGEPLGHGNSVRTVAFSPDGATLASGSEDSTVRLWEVASRRPLDGPLDGHGGPVRSVGFSPDGAMLVSGSEDGTVRLWDVDSRQPLGEPLIGRGGMVLSVAFSPQGEILASGSEDGKVRLWEVKRRRLLGDPLIGHSKWVQSIAFSPDWPILASGSADGTARLWELVTPQPLGEGRDATGIGSKPLNLIVEFVAFNRDGATLASATADGTVRLWDVVSRQQVGEPLTGLKGILALSPDGLASGNRDGTVWLWDIASRQPLGEPLTGHGGFVQSVAFSPDGAILASGGNDGTVRLWDIASRQPLGEPLTGHGGFVRSFAFSPDGSILASGGNDDTVRLWDIASRQPLGEPLTGHGGFAQSVAFSPDGSILASGGMDDTVRLWDVASRQRVGALTGSGRGVVSVAFSPDGAILASGNVSGAVQLWDVANRQRLGNLLIGHRHWVSKVAFSPDGTILASSSHDGTIRFWDVDPASWVTRACRRASRNLSMAEWRQYLDPGVAYRRTCPDLPPGVGVPGG